MVKEQIELRIITPDRVFYDGTVEMIVLNTTEGEVGILKNHEPATVLVKSGLFKLILDEKEKIAAVHGGYAEIQPDKITILTESAEWPEEIDVQRAQEAKKRAEKQLTEKETEVELVTVEAALLRALTRLEISNNE